MQVDSCLMFINMTMLNHEMRSQLLLDMLTTVQGQMQEVINVSMLCDVIGMLINIFFLYFNV